MRQYEYIYEIVKDVDGIDCFIKRGEIVHCSDCVHGSPDGNGYRCEQVPCLSWKAEDFCSKGRRKENEPMG